MGSLRILFLSSSLLTDRILGYTSLLPRLAKEFQLTVWSTSKRMACNDALWDQVPAQAEPMPACREYPVPRTLVRRLNDFTWDYRLQNPSRLSMLRHIRDGQEKWWVKSLRPLAQGLAALGAQEPLESLATWVLDQDEPSLEARERLQELRPDLVVSLCPFLYDEPPVVSAARKLGIPTAAFITSWDNISIKHRLLGDYKAYMVWSDRMEYELKTWYPRLTQAPIFKVGPPQFDILRDDRYYLSRSEFCAPLGLDPAKPIIIHALGVANNIEEHYGALEFAKRVARGDAGDIQWVVRPHPFNAIADLKEQFKPYAPAVAIQETASDPRLERRHRFQSEQQIEDWVNTFRHANVVVHLSSTVAIDGALFDVPVVGMDYDPMPGSPRNTLAREVNHLWTHYKPVAESGGMRLGSNPDEVIAEVKEYLRNPARDAAERRRMAEFVCGYTDGRCAARMAGAVSEIFYNATGVRKRAPEPEQVHLNS
jgi:hypothetical protein